MKARIMEILSHVMDPEIPVLSIASLGILREVNVLGEIIEVVITPTYSGCPAMDMIREDIFTRLSANGFSQVRIRTVLAPAWTTDWMTTDAREKLVAFGIAAPLDTKTCNHITARQAIHCPQCRSSHTSLLSEFSSTACKALYRCHDCLEAFDYFKCH